MDTVYALRDEVQELKQVRFYDLFMTYEFMVKSFSGCDFKIDV